MTTALVTGATGFIGQYLVNYLLEKNISVRVLVRQIRPNFFSEQVEQRLGDLTDPHSLKGLLDNVDVVFHLGGFAHAWKESADTDLKHQQINLQGTQFLFAECIRAQVKKFIFFSTVKAVGDTESCIDENWNELPNTPYGIAKRTAEDFILAQGKMHHMHTCVLRLALVYGPGIKGNLLQMLRAIDKGYFLPIPPVPNHRSLVSLNDVCQAAWLAAECEAANGKIYFVADKNTYSTYQIYTEMRLALGRPRRKMYLPLWVFKLLAWAGDQAETLLRRRLPFNSQTLVKLFGSSQCSSLRIQTELGFNPEYPLAVLLPSIIKKYKE